MTEQISDYEWGRSAELRIRRARLGLTIEDMVTKMSSVSGKPMSRRSYQRMEKADAAIHRSIWDTLDLMDAEHARNVRQLISMVRDQNNTVILNQDTASDWLISVIAEAMRQHPELTVKSDEDLLAEKEMTG